MPYFRRRMVYEILNKQLLWNETDTNLLPCSFHATIKAQPFSKWLFHHYFHLPFCSNLDQNLVHVVFKQFVQKEVLIAFSFFVAAMVIVSEYSLVLSMYVILFCEVCELFLGYARVGRVHRGSGMFVAVPSATRECCGHVAMETRARRNHRLHRRNCRQVLIETHIALGSSCQNVTLHLRTFTILAILYPSPRGAPRTGYY